MPPTPPLPRRQGRQRRTATRLWHVLLAGLALVLGGITLGEWMGWPLLRAPVERGLARALDREVALAAPFAIRFIGPLRLQAAQLRIGPARWPGENGAGPAPDLLQASEARLVLPWSTVWGLLQGSAQPPRLRLLQVQTLDANLQRDARGRANWKLGRPDEQALRPASAASAASAPMGLPQIDQLELQQGRIRLDDAPLALAVDAQLSTEEGRLAEPAEPAGLRLQATGSLRELPLQLRLSSSGLLPLLRSAGSDAPPTPLRLEARVGRAELLLDGQGTDLLQLGNLQGRYELKGPSLAAVGDVLGITLPSTARFQMRGSLRKTGPVWQTRVEALEVGRSRLRGSFRYDRGPPVPLLSGKLEGSQLLLADLGPAFGKPTPEQPARATPGRALPQREFDIPSLHAMNADVELDLERLDFGTPKLAPLAPLKGRVRLQDRVLSIRELLARSSEGELRGLLSVDAREPRSPLWDMQLQVAGLKLERFLRVRNPRNDPKAPTRARGADSAYVSGLLHGSAQARGQGRSMAAVLASMNGQLRLWLRQGELSHLLIEAAGIDIAESLGLLLTRDRRLPMRCAVAQLRLSEGKAVPEVALIDTGDSTLTLSGQLSFRDESLALRLNTSPHDVSLVTLRGPVRIEGRFSDPEIRLDKRRIGARLAGAALLGSVAPLAALLPLIDLGEDDRAVCQQALARLR